MSIFAVIVLVLGGAAYFYFDRQNAKRKNYQEQGDPDMSMQTAQDFINIKDIGENCLYTLDDKIFAFVKIEGISLELYSNNELHNLSNKCSKQLSKFARPYKYIAVSRRVDLSKTLQMYVDLYGTAEGGRKALIRQEIEELTRLEMSGDTLERQHYIAVWAEKKDEHEKQILAGASELARIFNDSGMKANVIDGGEIINLCSLVNLPDYAHIERNDMDITIAALINAG